MCSYISGSFETVFAVWNPTAICTLRYAKADRFSIAARALTGGDIVNAHGSLLFVRLVPVSKPGKRKFGALKGKIAIDARFFEPLPDGEAKIWGIN